MLFGPHNLGGGKARRVIESTGEHNFVRQQVGFPR